MSLTYVLVLYQGFLRHFPAFKLFCMLIVLPKIHSPDTFVDSPVSYGNNLAMPLAYVHAHVCVHVHV